MKRKHTDTIRLDWLEQNHRQYDFLVTGAGEHGCYRDGVFISSHATLRQRHRRRDAAPAEEGRRKVMWTKLSTKRPPMLGNYLTSNLYGGVNITLWGGSSFADTTSSPVTHWAKLPSPVRSWRRNARKRCGK